MCLVLLDKRLAQERGEKAIRWEYDRELGYGHWAAKKQAGIVLYTAVRNEWYGSIPSISRAGLH
jgi:hypothetical protein